MGIATCYGLDDPGVEFRGGGEGCEFSAAIQAVLEPTHPPVQWVTDLFLTIKRPGRVIDHPSKSSAKLHFCSSFWLFMAYYRAKFTFTLTLLHLPLDNSVVTAFGIVQYIVILAG